MEFKCILTIEVEGNMEGNYTLDEVINNFDIILKHKDNKILSSHWPYGETPAMRSQKITSIKLKQIEEEKCHT